MRKIAKEVSAIADRVQRGTESKVSTSTAIGMTIAITTAQQARLPSALVEDVREYWVTDVLPVVSQMIDELNEYCVFDRPGTLELTRKIYIMRYEAVYAPTTRSAINATLFLLMNKPSIMSGDVQDAVSCLHKCLNVVDESESSPTVSDINVQIPMMEMLERLSKSFDEYGYTRVEE